ncbi:MAG: S8 family peptidase [Elusimicrobia bacterium]|nr:S8 family peptidase [Elusimicrobiota bacterium]MDE2424726.1 S8 family peptidase [Elusimicrobiota bacterium]
MRKLLAVLAAASLAAQPALAFKIERLSRPSVAGAAGAAPIEVVAEQILVKFDPAATGSERSAALAAVRGKVLGQILGWTIVELPSGASVVAALAVARGMPGVSAASPNHVFRPLAVPNDPAVPSQYSLQQVNAFAGWEYERGYSNKVTVVIIDSGIDATHPDLSGKLGWTAASAVKHQSVDNNTGALTAEASPTASCLHGTQVASVAAASTDNSQGIAGMSWGAQLLSLKVFNTAGCNGPTQECGCATTDTAIASALDYVANTVAAPANAAAVGRIVVNMSLGGPGACGVNPLTETALKNLQAKGVPVAIASGNAPFCSDPNADGTGVDSPANCAGVAAPDGIIPVGATDAADDVTSYSCTGPELAKHGLVAPGDRVAVDTPGGGTTTDSGTSFAAPHVAGLAALMLSAKPGLTTGDVETSLRGGADSIGGAAVAALGARPSGNVTGAGRMDAFRSLRLAIKGTLADYQGDQKAIAFPNPFRLSQTGSVAFSVPLSLQAPGATIKIYTMDGVLVRTLSGLTWDAKNDSGSLVASGVYIFLLTTDAGSTRGRLAVIR